MALASIFGPNMFKYRPDGVIELYESFSAVRTIYRAAAEWTGLSTETLLYQNDFADDEQMRSRVGSVALAAVQLGIHDVLEAKGIRPGVVGGLSLGGMVSSCVAGSLGRKDLFHLLFRSQHLPDSDHADRREAVAPAFLPVDFDPDWYYGEEREGVYLGADFGYDVSESCRILLFTGYRDALQKLAAEAPKGAVQVSPDSSVAVHSPLRGRASDLLSGQLDDVEFSDPALPLCSGLEPKTLRTVPEVKEMFIKNMVDPMNIVALTREMKDNGATLGFALGPSMIKDLIKFPFPVRYIDSPEGLAEAVAAAGSGARSAAG